MNWSALRFSHCPFPLVIFAITRRFWVMKGHDWDCVGANKEGDYKSVTNQMSNMRYERHPQNILIRDDMIPDQEYVE